MFLKILGKQIIFQIAQHPQDKSQCSKMCAKPRRNIRTVSELSRDPGALRENFSGHQFETTFFSKALFQ